MKIAKVLKNCYTQLEMNETEYNKKWVEPKSKYIVYNIHIGVLFFLLRSYILFELDFLIK